MSQRKTRRGHRLNFGQRNQLVTIGVAVLSVATITLVAAALLIPRNVATSSTPPQVIPTIATPAPRLDAAFMGDSYTAGAGSSVWANSFTNLVANSQGWNEKNFGRGGTGYTGSVSGAVAKIACGLTYCPSYEEMIVTVAAKKPAIVFVSGGRNQASEDQLQLARGITKFYSDLRAALPNVKIFATSPVWDSSATPASLQLMASAVKEATEAVGGVYLDIGQPLHGHPELITADHVHPNDAGHLAIAKAIEAALRG